MVLTDALHAPYGDGPEAPAFHLRTLGGAVLVSRAAGTVDMGGQRKAMALLALLAVAGAAGVTRDKVVGYLWPETDDERARNALSQLLFRVRRDLGADAVTGTGTLQLNAAVLDADVVRFHQALAARDPATAAAIYGGPFLDGFFLKDAAEFERWVASERARLEQAYLQALETLAAQATRAGDHAAAADWWRHRVNAEPLGGRSARAYVEALVMAGDRDAALRFGATYTALVRAELDVSPDPDLTARLELLRSEAYVPPVVTTRTSVGAGALPPAGGGPVPAGAVAAVEDGGATAGRSRRALWVVGSAVMAIAALAVVSLRRARPEYAVGRAVRYTSEPGLEILPSLSPDGTLLAYVAGPLNRTRILVRPLGGPPVAVAGDSGPGQAHPAWSPDGNRLAFVRGNPLGSLEVIPALGGVARVLVADSVLSAAWSRDGRRIAFVRRDSVFVIAADGGTPVAVTGPPDASEVGEIAWSPDGRLLAMSSGNNAYAAVSSVDLGNRGPSRIVVVSATGGPAVSVTDAGSANTSPAWSPDSRRLLFVSDRDGPRDVYVQRVDDAGRPVGGASRLTVGLSAHSIALSADGRKLAWSLLVQRANVWAMPLTGTAALEQVTTGTQVIENVAVSRDGRRLYFDSDHDGNADIWRVPLAGGVPERLTSDPADDFWPAESPDGRWVAFHTTRFGARAVMVMPAGGGDAVRVSADSVPAWKASWTPDGHLVFESRGPIGALGTWVAMRDSAGTWSARRLPDGVGGGGIAPDSRQFVDISDGVSLVPLAGGPRRWLYRPRPGTVDPEFGAAAWLPDGRALVLKAHDRDTDTFWLLNVTGGTPRLIARLDDPDRLSPRNELATDGRHIYFVVTDRQSDVLVADIAGLR